MRWYVPAMGFFDLHCVESGLALNGPTALLVISKQHERWLPCAVPAFDTYDRLGGLDTIFLDDAGDTILSSVHVASLPQGGQGLALEDRVSELCVGHGTWAGRETSYTLVDAAVYRAVAETMRQREGFDDRSLDALTWPALVARAIPLADARRHYERIESPDVAAMKALVRFTAWGTALRPAHELPSGQYSGLTPSDPNVTFAFTLDAVERARARYAGLPLLLEAVEDNADRWSELDSDDARAQRARRRGKPVAIRVERLFVARLMTGEHVLEIAPRDVPLVTRLLRERLLGHGEAIHLESSGTAVTFTPATDPSWRKDEENGRFVFETTSDATAELIGAFLGAASASVAMRAYPGLRVRT